MNASVTTLSSVARPRLHIPEEPIVQRDVWRQAIDEGASIGDVVSGEGDVASWFWLRWRAVEAAGMPEERFRAVVFDYRRELWFWLAGERTWSQCVTGLIGRIDRRLDAESTSTS